METQELLDGQAEQDHQNKTGTITEDDVYQSVAGQMGWTPKDKWTRDPAKWVDARTFVTNTPSELKSLKERLKRTTQAAEQVIDDTRRRVREEIEAELAAAEEAGDGKRMRAAAEKLADAKAEEAKPHPETLAWMARNPWFEADEEAQAVARAAVVRAAKAGASIAEQLEAGENAARKRFPEHFPSERRQEEHQEQRQERKPPVVAEGGRTTRTQSKDKSFADIPPADKAEYRRRFAKKYESMGMKPEDAEARYARAYWNNKGE